MAVTFYLIYRSREAKLRAQREEATWERRTEIENGYKLERLKIAKGLDSRAEAEI